MWVAFIVIALALPSGSTSAAAPSPRLETISGAELVERIRAAAEGQPDVDNVELVVTGEVDLRGLRTVSRPLRCTKCTFEGSIRADDVGFAASVDLAESTFHGPVDITGARFEGRLGLDSADFRAELDARDAQFAGRTSFDGVRIAGAASFDRAVFEERAVLPRSDFGGRASFAGVSFGAPAEFTTSTFRGEGVFEQAAFNAGGTFAAANFMGDATFNGVALTGELDLGFAILEGSTTFSAMSGTGTLVLERLCLCLPPGDGRRAPQLLMSKMTLDGLVMDLDLVPAVRGPAVALDVLEVVEATARRDGDTGTANRAHFDLLTRRNDELAQPERFLDAAFYGGAAGYLVRPRNPLLCLLALLVIGGLIRAWPRVAVAWRRLQPAPGAISQPVSRLGAARLLFVSVVVALCQGLSRTLSRSWSIRKRPEPVPAQHPFAPARMRPYVISGLRWGEWLAVKVLIAVALLAIANANATVRELVEAVI